MSPSPAAVSGRALAPELLDNPVRTYAWGSRTAIPELLGQDAPAAEPQAELWLGAHPADPSRLASGPTLAEAVAADPEGTLGAAARGAFGDRLPFLLKVLAADRPLSLQVHPSPEQAAEGYAREEAAGVPLDAPERTFRDPWPKPELLCALTPFQALCGFRPVPESLDLWRAVVGEDPAATPVLDRLAAGDVAGAVRWLLADPAARALAGRAGRAGDAGADDAAGVASRLAAAYPGDPGVLVALLLNVVRLAPGEAVYLPAGAPHAYLHGVGIEVMACSDNVVRGGLTGKHVDADLLLRLLDARPGPPPLVRSEPVAPGVVRWPAPAREFALQRWRPSDAGGAAPAVDSPAGLPRIVLCVEGSLTLLPAAGGWGPLRLARGASAFLPAAAAARVTGDGTAYAASCCP